MGRCHCGAWRGENTPSSRAQGHTLAAWCVGEGGAHTALAWGGGGRGRAGPLCSEVRSGPQPLRAWGVPRDPRAFSTPRTRSSAFSASCRRCSE